MIEPLVSILAPAGTPGERLRADAVGACAADLSAAVTASNDDPGGSGLSAPELVDAIRALEELSCVVSAAQSSLSAELDIQMRAEREAHGVPADKRGQGIGAQVAHARRESPHRGSRHLSLATIIQRELPHTWAAWRAGRITEWKATIIARETSCLSLPDRQAVDAMIAEDPDRLEGRGDHELAGLVRSLAEQADPAAVVARRRKAEADRRVSIRPAPDTMVWLTALLPVAEGVSVWATLSRAADTAASSGDPRTRGQVMADALVRSAIATASSDAASPGVQLGLVMTDRALFAGSDEPAHLDGYGPIPAELAREIVTDTLTRDEFVWVRRLFTHPATGELIAADARIRRFRGSLSRFIRLRDRICRTPWCDAAIRHVDHAVDHGLGGATSRDNGQGMCEACNYAKQAPGWSAGPVLAGSEDGHTLRTTLPTGHSYTTRPPPLGPRTESPPLRIDYALTG